MLFHFTAVNIHATLGKQRDMLQLVNIMENNSSHTLNVLVAVWVIYTRNTTVKSSKTLGKVWLGLWGIFSKQQFILGIQSIKCFSVSTLLFLLTKSWQIHKFIMLPLLISLFLFLSVCFAFRAAILSIWIASCMGNLIPASSCWITAWPRRAGAKKWLF